MNNYLVLDFRGRPVVRLLAEDYASAVLFAFRGGVPGAHDVIGDGDDAGTDIKATEARLIASFREGGLSEAAAKVAARGRGYDPIEDRLRTIRVPRQSATAGSSAADIYPMRESTQERERRSVELREPGLIDIASEGLTELKERGASSAVAEGLTELYRAFRADGMSEKAAMVAARGRDSARYGTTRTIREGTQEMGAEIPIAYAQRMEYPAPNGSASAQWRIKCPLCDKIHFSPEQPTTQDITGMLGEQAMLCQQGVANVVDAATNPPPELGTTKTVVPSGEAARDRDGLAEAEARLYDSFREGGLSEAEARVAARGRDRR